MYYNGFLLKGTKFKRITELSNLKKKKTKAKKIE